jgi:hypothetical protein
MNTDSDSTLRVPMSVCWGFVVLAAGLGMSVAMLTGFGQAVSCGTFGMDCVGWAFGTTLFTLCATLVLLLRGVGAMHHSKAGGGRGGPWLSVVKVLTIILVGVVGLAILLLGGFAVLVAMR